MDYFVYKTNREIDHLFLQMEYYTESDENSDSSNRDKKDKEGIINTVATKIRSIIQRVTTTFRKKNLEKKVESLEKSTDSSKVKDIKVDLSNDTPVDAKTLKDLLRKIRKREKLTENDLNKINKAKSTASKGVIGVISVAGAIAVIKDYMSMLPLCDELLNTEIRYTKTKKENRDSTENLKGIHKIVKSIADHVYNMTHTVEETIKGPIDKEEYYNLSPLDRKDINKNILSKNKRKIGRLNDEISVLKKNIEDLSSKKDDDNSESNASKIKDLKKEISDKEKEIKHLKALIKMGGKKGSLV